MKNIVNSFLIIVFSFLSLVSCENVIDGNNMFSDRKVNVKILLNDFNLSIEDDNTRASDKTAYDAGVNRISLSVFNENGEKVFTATKNSSLDVDDFDVISCTLYPGDYSFVAVAYKSYDDNDEGADIVSVESAKITASKLWKTWAVNQTVKIESDKTNEVVIDFGKCVSAQFQLVPTDDQPDNVAFCEIILNPTAALTSDYSFNPTTGFALEKYQYKVNFSINKATVGSIKGKSLGVFCLVTEAEQIVDVIINMKDESGNLVKSRTFSNVPLKPNNVTRATGAFFNSSTKTSFLFDAGTASIINIDF